MRLFQMITFFLVSTLAFANEYQCANEIIDYEQTRLMYPLLVQSSFTTATLDERTNEFLHEVKSFCECKTNLPQGIDPIFPDVKVLLAHEDSCAGKYFGKNGLTIHYEVSFVKLSHEVLSRLNQRYPKSIRSLASVGSVNNKLQCLHQNIIKRCSHSKSLQMSYQCILEATTSRDFSRFEAKCPEFNDSETLISENNDLFI